MDAHSTEQQFYHALSLIGAGNSSELRQLGARRVSQYPGDVIGYTMDIAGLVLQRDILTALNAVHAYETHKIVPSVMAERVGRILLDGGAYESLCALAAAAQSAPSFPIWIYFAGCAHLMSDRMDEAIRYFDGFSQLIGGLVKQDGLSLYVNDGPLNLMLRQGRLVNGPDEVKRRIETFRTCDRHPDLKVISSPSEDGPLFLVSCDGLYFQHFGSIFIDGLMTVRPDCRLHVHVTMPTSETRSIFGEADKKYPGRLGIGVTENPPYRNVTYFTCERFFIAEMLLKRYEVPVVTLDLDDTPTASAPDFHAFTRNADFSCYRTSRNEPASFYQAAVMCFPPTDEAVTFLQGLQAYCFSGELENPPFVTWMLDQAALFSVSHYFRKGQFSGLRFTDLNESGIEYKDAFTTFASEEDKNAIKLPSTKLEASVTIRL